MKSYIVLGFPIALAACAAETDPVSTHVLAPSATPDVTVANAVRPGLVSDYVRRPVKGPGSWGELNNQQSPNAETN